MGRAILAKSGQDYLYRDLANAIVHEYAGVPPASDDEDSAVLRVAKLVS